MTAVGGFWIAEGFSAAQVQTASAAVAIGLTPRTGAAPAKFGVSAFGDVFPKSYAPNDSILNPRGYPRYIGGLAVEAMIQAIWPSFKDWHQAAFPPSADITPATLLSCVIFWLISLPILYLNTRRLRWVFVAKIATMPFLWVALFTWALTASHGFGPLLKAPSKPTNGMSTGYLFCYAITASSSGANSLAVNMPDLTRYAHNPQTSTIAQAIGLPVALTLSKSLPRPSTKERYPLTCVGRKFPGPIRSNLLEPT
ncbi:MAG: hypothetical protein L6R40_005669 [Gallowayella cf. fulva]|nr:MAG: hypothetical protein L6R40_005669 [Xanthomendoza cf. fulva]